jgi:hypothetical protein
MAAVLASSAALALTGQPAEPVDRATISKIRSEGLERSQVGSMFDMLANVIGPRLTASPAYKASADWARGKLESWGLQNARLESWEFGRGWTLEGFTLEMTEPRYMPLIGYPEGWSASTPDEIVGVPIALGGLSFEEIERQPERLKGAIVLTQPIQTSFVRQDRVQPTDSATDPPPPAPRATGAGRAGRGQTAGRGRGQGRGGQNQLPRLLHDAGVGVVLKTSRGEHGTMFVLGRDPGDLAVPSVIVAAEHYNLIARLIALGQPVKLRVNVRTRYHDADRNGYNVLAELPGSDPALRDEVVMIGAHLDSWHSATGATDNADGSAIALEAMRILKAIDARPRRTIRVALWGGEEQGLLGSRQWVQQHLEGEVNAAAREKLSVYLNIDPGTGPVYGFFLENKPAIKPIFDAWLEPFKDMGARRNVLQGIGSTDHLSFHRAGIPGFNPVQSYDTYDVRTHHTNVDTFERVREEDLKQAAVIFASFAYHAANRDQRMPRD